jgi:hypothetical protein
MNESQLSRSLNQRVLVDVPGKPHIVGNLVGYWPASTQIAVLECADGTRWFGPASQIEGPSELELTHGNWTRYVQPEAEPSDWAKALVRDVQYLTAQGIDPRDAAAIAAGHYEERL